MTASEYAQLHIEIPEAMVSIASIPGLPGEHLITVAKDGKSYSFTKRLAEIPTGADVLHRLLYVEANWATMFLREFVGEWPDKTWIGRVEAVKEWIRLRRQRTKLKKMFGNLCP